MKSLAVRFKESAAHDLAEIYRIILSGSQSPKIALAFTQRLQKRCQTIGDAPFGGRPRDDLAQGLRTVPFEACAVIAYRVTDTVEITNIFYGGRDYEALYHPASGKHE